MTRWALEPLLALRTVAEERASAEVARRRAAAREAEACVAATAQALRAVLTGPDGARSAADLAAAARFVACARGDLANAARRAEGARAAVREGAEGHARARLDVEVLARARRRWAGARLRAREAALERELDDLAAR